MWQLASFFGEPVKIILAISSDSFGKNSFLYELYIMVEMLDSFSLIMS
jgi:hypothetical protein